MSKKNRRKKFTYFCFRINFTKTLRLYMATNGKKHKATPFLYFLLLRFSRERETGLDRVQPHV